MDNSKGKLHYCEGCHSNYSCDDETCEMPNVFACDHHLNLVKNNHGKQSGEQDG